MHYRYLSICDSGEVQFVIQIGKTLDRRIVVA